MAFSFIRPARAVLQPLQTSPLVAAEVEAVMLRLDLLHPTISGNKWFKLKYNLKAAVEQGKDTILTFGGARSNHIAATATACRILGLKSIGIIRGNVFDNPTLTHAKKEGMRLFSISRAAYKNKEEAAYLRELNARFPNAYIIPEGGNNKLGIKGAEEILSLHDTQSFTHICCPMGTGATLAGLVTAAEKFQKVLGFSALRKADDQRLAIKKQVENIQDPADWEILTNYSFGGFAKKTKTLTDFMDSFYQKTGIPLDFVYTAKMMFGITDLVEKEQIPPLSRLLILHTGGLQGNKSAIPPPPPVSEQNPL